MIRFIIGATAFAKALAQVAPAVVNSPVVPILENVKLTCQRVSGGHQLVLTCSDMETTLQAELQAVESAAEWQLCVPAKKLLQTLRDLPEQPLTCEVDLDTYRFELRAARSRYVLAGENAADFPGRPQIRGPLLAVPANALRAALVTVLPTVHTDYSTASRMCGVYFETRAGELVALAATDGHRVHQYVLAAGQGDAGFTVPTRAASLLLAVLEASGSELVRLQASGDGIALADGRWNARLIDERFPDYRNVMPVHNPLVATVDRDELAAALRRIDRYANEKTRQVRLRFSENSLETSAEDLDSSNEGAETLDCHYEGEPFTIGFNIPFVLTQLKALAAGPVRLGMSAPNRAWVLTSEAEGDAPTAVTLVMPVMLLKF